MYIYIKHGRITIKEGVRIHFKKIIYIKQNFLVDSKAHLSLCYSSDLKLYLTRRQI